MEKSVEPKQLKMFLSTAPSQGRKERPTYNKRKEGCLEWSHIVEELFSKTRY